MILFYRAFGIFVNFIEIMIIVRIFMNILNINFGNPIGRFIYEITEPLLGLARKLIYSLGINTGVFDFSPLLAILLLRIIYSLLARILLMMLV